MVNIKMEKDGMEKEKNLFSIIIWYLMGNIKMVRDWMERNIILMAIWYSMENTKMEKNGMGENTNIIIIN